MRSFRRPGLDLTKASQAFHREVIVSSSGPASDIGAVSQPAAMPENSLPVHETWPSFLYLAMWAFLLYGIGAATPYCAPAFPSLRSRPDFTPRLWQLEC